MNLWIIHPYNNTKEKEELETKPPKEIIYVHVEKHI